MDLPTYHAFTHERLAAMGRIYHGGRATPFQAAKYEHIRACLLAELRSIYPEAKDKGSAVYLHGAIAAVLHNRQREGQKMIDRLIANGHTARQQLKNWK